MSHEKNICLHFEAYLEKQLTEWQLQPGLYTCKNLQLNKNLAHTQWVIKIGNCTIKLKITKVQKTQFNFITEEHSESGNFNSITNSFQKY